MFLIWLILFGIFAKMYLPEHPEGDLDIVRMKHAAWVDLVNLLLWGATMIWSGLRWWQGRIRKSKEEGESAAAAAAPPVAASAAHVATPNPVSNKTARTVTIEAPQHDDRRVVSRPNSSEDVYEDANSEERAVSPAIA